MAQGGLRTPLQDGFHWPAEWAPQAACWMLWPERPDVWRQNARPAQRAFAALASAIARFQPVIMGVSAAGYARARKLLPPAVRVVELSANDAWMRDVGPSFVLDRRRRLRGVHWRFAAWGGLYADVGNDRAVAAKQLELIGAKRYAAPMVLENGSIHGDGQGTILTTEQCLLEAKRNPGLSRRRIERHLRAYLGGRAVIWLGQGLPNDETDGHVDNLCCFIKPGEVALAWTDDAADPFYQTCRDALRRLQAARDAKGRALKVHRLPQPKPLRRTAREAATLVRRPGSKRRRAGERLGASYVNFFVGNGVVVMPLFGQPSDQRARRALRRLFPGRAVIGVPAREIVLGGGGIHCVTLSQPRSRGGER
jgi:agmatine deiminase